MIASILILAASPLLFVLGLRGYSAVRASGSIYDLENVPERPIAVIFGAAVYRSGNPSPMLADRLETGARLYRAGKVKALLLTGDNHLVEYNEPEAMRRYLLSRGIPDIAMTLDYAGFRTYDSCYRAHDIFGVRKAILVTQAFHLDRALLICRGLGLDAVGVAADGVRPTGYQRSSLLYSQVRELPSTAMAVLDLLSGRLPTFLGDPLPIFPDVPPAER
jgi:SanA protein